MNTEQKKVLELAELVVNWYTDLLTHIDKMVDKKIKSIEANVDGELITLLDDPQRVRDAQLGMYLVKQLLEKCPITIEKENKWNIKLTQ